MKEFTLEFADNEEFDNARRVKTKAGGVELRSFISPILSTTLTT